MRPRVAIITTNVVLHIASGAEVGAVHRRCIPRQHTTPRRQKVRKQLRVSVPKDGKPKVRSMEAKWAGRRPAPGHRRKAEAAAAAVGDH